MVKFTQFVTLKELKEKSTFLNIPAKTFEAGDFPNIFGSFGGDFSRFWDFLGLFSYKNVSNKTRVSETNKSTV